jgi:RNA polymerase sigma-70 factor (ECF subfamily)
MTKKSAPSAKGFAPSTKSISAAKRDAAWMERIKTGKDAQALSDLFEVYRPKLKGWLMARGVGSGTAEDIVQDVMIKVWTRAVLFDPEKASFATWVYRLTRNKWIDHQRKHGRMDVRDPE